MMSDSSDDPVGEVEKPRYETPVVRSLDMNRTSVSLPVTNPEDPTFTS